MLTDGGTRGGEARLTAPTRPPSTAEAAPWSPQSAVAAMACTLLSGVHGVLAQIVLCALALGSLTAKRLVEKPRRPLPVRHPPQSAKPWESVRQAGVCACGVASRTRLQMITVW